jgi:hypothetical protein
MMEVLGGSGRRHNFVVPAAWEMRPRLLTVDFLSPSFLVKVHRFSKWERDTEVLKTEIRVIANAAIEVL